ncbi:fimbrillin family protein [Bacteroides thetaiotaomicron]|uniref:fimbrillin family protein n=1 Tax=Bacteroides thetaiotaomicron TaxID=818 RepID=UPI0013EDC454|nr:fimbrillin family protein [Parabacteroides goldsteinii]
MKKHILFLVTGIALLFGSCSNDEIVPEQPKGKSAAPQLVATVEQAPTTRSGVIENNGDYINGEKFYWSNGDQTTVLFRNSSMTDKTEYKKVEYAASVADGVQSNSCTFNVTQAESIDNDQYTVYGFFPTAAWDTRANYTSFLTANVPAYQTQNEANSTHLGAYMLMKAQNDVTVDGNSPINLSYKHLASVLRFAVWNNSGNNNLKLANINVKLASGKAVFATNARLVDIDAASLTVSTDSKVPDLILELNNNAQSFSSKDGKDQCEGYMAVLPTATDAFESSDDLIIELSFTDGANKYLVTKTYNIGTDLSFLSNGIEQGKSYYFQLKVDNGDLNAITGTSYAVGDYWPNSSSPEGIVFWVKPGSFGTQGKVVGLNETYVAKWGVDNDEQAAGVAGIRSLTDGKTATKSMIAQYKNSATFAADYPAFHYIYNTVNSGNDNGVWHLPARDELKMLYAGYSGKTYESIVNWMSMMPGYDSPECATARTAFNTMLTAKGGAAIAGSGGQSQDWYLSSSEKSLSVYYSFDLKEGIYSSDPKNFDGYIRWIREY